MVVPSQARPSPDLGQDQIDALQGSKTVIHDDAMVAWTQKRQVAAPTVAVAIGGLIVVVCALFFLYFRVATLTVRASPSIATIGTSGVKEIAPDVVLIDQATLLANIQYGWTPTTVANVVDRMSPFLSPKIRTEFAAGFRVTAEESQRYRRVNHALITAASVFDRSKTGASVAVHIDLGVGRGATESDGQYGWNHNRYETLIAVYVFSQGMSTAESPSGLIIESLVAMPIEQWKSENRQVFW